MYQLYYAPDNASLIIRMALEELEAEYSTVLVDRSSAEQQSETYLALNPNGLIPVCVINEKPVYETGAILLSLAERHRELAPPLNDPDRAQFLKWLFFLSNSVHTDLRQLFYPDKYAGVSEQALRDHRQLAIARLLRGFAVLNDHCAVQDGVFVMDEEITVIDIYLATLLRWSQLYPRAQACLENLQEFPALEALCAAVEARPGVQRACTAEGISLPFFESPQLAEPREGSAT